MDKRDNIKSNDLLFDLQSNGITDCEVSVIDAGIEDVFMSLMRKKEMSNNKKVIEVSELTRKFGRFTAVDNISFDVYEGEIFGFLGANGAGKTTAMKMLIGLLAPTSGKATVAGYDVYKQSEQIKKALDI